MLFLFRNIDLCKINFSTENAIISPYILSAITVKNQPVYVRIIRASGGKFTRRL